MKQTVSLGTKGSFGKALLRLRIIESMKLIEGDSIFAIQCRMGASDPANYDQIISDVWGQMGDNYSLVEGIIGTEITFMVSKYFNNEHKS